MGYLDYFQDEFNAVDPMESASYLRDYQTKSITGCREPDYNYEYDRFPKNFTFTKNFMGVPSNPNASKLDKFYTESYLTNKIRHIEDVYLGSNEAPEEYSRVILPQEESYASYSSPPRKCNCRKCQEGIIQEYMDKQNINRALDELQKRNETLTIILIFVAIYCIIQIFYQPRGYSMVSETTYVEQPKPTPIPVATAPAST